MAKTTKTYRAFEAALASFIQEHMPWPYSDVERYSDEANDAAWAVAKAQGPKLWAELREAR